MHLAAQHQADIPAQGHGIGAYAHFLIGGNARVGAAQVRRADAAAREQGLAGQPLGLEGVEHQRHRVEGSEMSVQHRRLQRVRYGERASCVPSAVCQARLKNSVLA